MEIKEGKYVYLFQGIGYFQ